jgi:hypothetical protein
VLTALLNETGLTFAIVGKTVTVYAADPNTHPTVVSPPGDSRKNAPKTGSRRRADIRP